MSCHSSASSVQLRRAACGAHRTDRSNSRGRCRIPETAFPVCMPEYTRTSFSSASLDELIAAVRTGDLDFPLAHRHTHFLTAFRTAEDAVCLVGAFLAEQGANRSRDLQELLVFCLAACNIPGEDPEVGIDQNSNCDQIQRGADCGSSCENRQQQEKQKHAEQRLVECIISAVSALHKLCKPFSPVCHCSSLHMCPGICRECCDISLYHILFGLKSAISKFSCNFQKRGRHSLSVSRDFSKKIQKCILTRERIS